jgi:ParB family chromosome partitioning protein
LREDLRPIEQARAFRALMNSNGWSARQLARELAIDNSGVIRALALLDLPEAVQGHVERGTLSPATAYEVAKLPEPTMQAEVAAAAVSEGLTRPEVVEFVQAVKAKRLAPAARPEPATIDIGDGVVVTIHWKKACPVGAVHALKKALKIIQEREKPDQAA